LEEVVVAIFLTTNAPSIFAPEGVNNGKNAIEPFITK
jgi:hypothetical protein